MAKLKKNRLLFPFGGVDRANLYRQQPPYTTYDATNVWPKGPFELRNRGGSRYGLIQSHAGELGDSGSEIWLLTSIVYSPGIEVPGTGSDDTSTYTTFIDLFEDGTMSSDWSAIPDYGGSTTPHTLYEGTHGHYQLASDQSDHETGTMYKKTLIDQTKPVSFGIFIAFHDGGFHGTYEVSLLPSELDIWVKGVAAEITMDDATGDYEGKLTVNEGEGSDEYVFSGTHGNVDRGWFLVEWEPSSKYFRVFWRGDKVLEQDVSLAAQMASDLERLVVESECTNANGKCRIGRVKLNGNVLGLGDGGPDLYSMGSLRTMLVASAYGSLYYESTYGVMTELDTDLTLASGSLLQAAQSGQKLYIADRGDWRVYGEDGTVSGSDLDAAGVADWTALGIDTDDDVAVLSSVGGATTADTYTISSVVADKVTLGAAPGDGTCTYRIERGPKVYDPVAGTLTLWSATDGQVPTGCPLICRYCDRMVLAGADQAPHVWFMSRKRDPDDWDYSQADSEAAVAGTSAEAGVPGRAITALAPYKDDYLVIGSLESLWLMRGDPGYGGSLDSLSRTVGIISPNAWCIGPSGEFIFLSLHGLYAVPQIHEGGQVLPISDATLPEELSNISPREVYVSLEYDTENTGVHIFLSSASSTQRKHWFLEWNTKTYWRMSLASDHDPICTHVYKTMAPGESGVLLAGRDGCIRKFDREAITDTGTAISSNVYIGPVALAPDGAVGSVRSLDAVLSEDSDDVTWELMPADTYEGTVSASVYDTGTWSSGLNATDYPASRGQAVIVNLNSTGQWAMEQILMTSRESGRRRLL